MLSAHDSDIARFDELVDYTRYAVRLRYASADPRREATRPWRDVGQVGVLLEEVRRRLAEAEGA